MKNQRASILPILLLGTVLACAGSRPAQIQGPQPLPKPPVITRAFAAKEIRLGATWKVYLIAEDPRGEMKYITATIYQPGVGTSYVSRTRLRPEDERSLNGFVYWNTPLRGSFLFTSITLRLDIQDQSGQHSREVQFPLAFTNNYAQEKPPAGVFQENNLGPIMIELRPIEDDREKSPFFGPRW